MTLPSSAIAHKVSPLLDNQTPWFEQRHGRLPAWVPSEQHFRQQRATLCSAASSSGGPSSKGEREAGAKRESEGTSDESAGNRTEDQERGEGKDAEQEEPLEEEEKLGAGGVMQLIGFGMLLGLVGVCGYYIVAELLPSKMSPNTVMSNAHEAFLADPDVSLIM